MAQAATTEALPGGRKLGIAMRSTGQGKMLIDSVITGSLAERAGMLAGDVLAEVNGKPVSLEDPSALLAALSTPSAFEATIERDGVRVLLSVPGQSAQSSAERQEVVVSSANEHFGRAAALETLAGTGNLRAAFNADKHKARLLVALSPT